MEWDLPQVGEVSRTTALEIARDLRLNPVVARVLVRRGIRSVAEAEAFLSKDVAALPDPFSMTGMIAAVDRIAVAVARGEKIALYGDYDVDGISSVALVSTMLGALGASTRNYIPHRLHEGYGLNLDAVDKLAAEGTQLLITLDCGVTAIDEIARANALGVDVIVVDHHALKAQLPAAVAVLNPMQDAEDFPGRNLCAAGVAFMLCLGLRKRFRERGAFATRPEPNLRRFLDLVALATVADVVPLVGLNRVLVHHGLKELTRAHRPGVRALKMVSQINGEVSATQVGFRLGPRINAGGRLGDAALGLTCLLAADGDVAMSHARRLDVVNRDRQAVERAMLDEAFELASADVARGARGLVLSGATWHPGVVGIVASRVVEKFHRPAVLVGFHDGVGRGSARSIHGFHLLDAITSCSAHLVKYGGHRAAAGVSVNADQLVAFRRAFEAYAQTHISDAMLIPHLRIDAEVEVTELSLETVDALAALGPFGPGNPEPTLGVMGVKVSGKVLSKSKPEGGRHLKLALEGAPNVSGIAFDGADLLPLTDRPVDIACRIARDDFRGDAAVELKVRAMRAEGAHGFHPTCVAATA